MENDSIRASGGDTLIDIWVDGKLRAISISRAAIETSLGIPAATEDERCEFVRTHLPQVVSAVKAQLRDGDPTAGTVSIEAGQLGGVGERRRSERRKSERRKVNRPASELPHGERRRSDRRKTTRRRPKATD